MVEYTWDDIIINPNSEKAQSCIGKKCYYADNPTACIDFANSNDEDMVRILQCIQSENTNFPFCFGTSIEYNHACIILKKEEELEYVPFESAEEFLNAYENSKYNVIKVTTGKQFISCGGIWLKSKSEAIWITQCINISDHGVTLGLARKFRVWKELLDDYRFLDGTPCGKKKE